MTGVSKTLSGSSILSSPVDQRLEVLESQVFLAFLFVRKISYKSIGYNECRKNATDSPGGSFSGLFNRVFMFRMVRFSNVYNNAFLYKILNLYLNFYDM